MKIIIEIYLSRNVYQDYFDSSEHHLEPSMKKTSNALKVLSHLTELKWVIMIQQ